MKFLQKFKNSEYRKKFYVVVMLILFGLGIILPVIFSMF